MLITETSLKGAIFPLLGVDFDTPKPLQPLSFVARGKVWHIVHTRKYSLEGYVLFSVSQLAV